MRVVPDRAAFRTWPTIVALAGIWILTVANQPWIFGILFICWALYDVRTGESYFIQRITRRHNPATFWAVVLSWITLSGLWIAYPT